jgi:hydroxylysine kinase
MTDTPLGPLLDSHPPVFGQDQVADLVSRHWGLTGRLAPLTSERDLNHRLDAPEGRFVVKIANAAEPHALTRFQNRALRHAAAADPTLPIPRVIAARDGADDVVLAQGNLMRVLTWVDGVPLAGLPQSMDQGRAVATLGARLLRAVRGLDDPAADHVLLWDIRHAAALRPLLPHVADAGLRALCTDVLDRFDTDVAPALPALPWQVIHGDLNPHNILGDPAAPDRVTGILDFGDMVRTPRLCDLAVAASYRIAPQDALGSLSAFAAAWHAIDPLMPAERDHLFDLVAARMVTTVAITAFRAARYPENAAYILRNVPSARMGLAAFAALDRATVARHIAAACP